MLNHLRTVLGAFAILLLPCLTFADPLAENQARLGVFSGDVQILTQGAAAWIDPHEGLPLEPGDEIKTGEDGEAEIILSENVLWRLEPNTDLETEHMDVNSGRFSLAEGSLVGKVDSAHAALGQRWEFNTPAAICTVRGTEFGLSFDPKVGTRLGVFTGEAEMQPAESASGEQPPVRIPAGREGVAPRGKPLNVLRAFSKDMLRLKARLTDLRKGLLHVQQAWTPFTQAMRDEIRKKFVPPIPKKPRARTPKRRRPPPTEGS